MNASSAIPGFFSGEELQRLAFRGQGVEIMGMKAGDMDKEQLLAAVGFMDEAVEYWISHSAKAG